MVTLTELAAPARSRSRSIVVREQFEQWFEAAAEVLRAIDVPVDWSKTSARSYEDASEHAGAEWSEFRSRYMRLDFELLTKAEHRTLHRHLTHALPQFLNWYAGAIVNKGHAYARYSKRGVFRWRRLRLTRTSKILGKQVELRSQQEKRQKQQRYQSALNLAMSKTALPVQKKLPEIKVAPSPKAHFSFLEAIRNFDSNLGQRAHELLGDWSRAYAKAAGAEDRYRLEQIVNEHLPELVRVLPGVTEASKQEAAELIREQLTLLHARVTRVLEQHEVDSMTALRAQTSFIRELAASDSSHLTLESSAQAQIEGAE